MNIAGTLHYDTKLDTKGFRKGMGTVKDIVAGIGITKIIGKAVDVLSSSLDGAINRVDTLNNYPKVMESLGYSTEKANKSIKKLSDGIEGLPTTLDEIVNNSQRLTSSLGDLDKGTETAIALNDMFLAGGQGAEAANRAFEQYNQIIAKGKVDMQSWNTLVEVAPGQMDQLAKSLLGAKANQRDLYQALQDGTISMEDFNNQVIKLDKEGGESFSSFREQAENATGGIGTSIANLKTSVVKGVANVIDAFNETLSKKGFLTIQGFFDKTKSEVNNFFKIIVGLIKGELKIEDVINDIVKKIQELLPKISEFLLKNIPVIINTGMQILSSLVNGMVTLLPTLIPIIMDILFKILDVFIDNIDVIINCALQIILALANGLIIALPKLLAKIPEIINKLQKAFTNPNMLAMIIQAAIQLVFALGKGLVKAWPEIILMIPRLIKNMFTTIKDVITKTNWKKLGKNILDGILNGLIDFGTVVYDTVTKLGKKITNSIKSFFGIKSPSRLMKNEVGKYISLGLADGIEDNIDAIDKAIDNINDAIYGKMRSAVNLEAGRMNASAMLRSNANFNSIIQVNNELTSDVYLDKQKVGQAITPVVSKTLKTAGVR